MPEEPTIQSTVVSSLLCAAHVEMAVDCLGSAQTSCREPLRFRIHDDGSLGSAELDRLTEGLAGEVEFVSRSKADERMAERLSAYPALTRLRGYYPVALKLLDAPLWDEAADEFRFLDSDILFLRPVSDVFSPVVGSDAIFMRDRESNYSLRSWQLAISGGLRLPRKVNSGIIRCRRSAYDLDFLNWFVSRKIHCAIPWVVEQTAWAAMGFRAAGGCRVLDPERVRVVREHEDFGSLCIGHFTARSRHLLPEFVARSKTETVQSIAPVSLATEPVEECRATDLLGYEMRRIAARFRLGGDGGAAAQSESTGSAAPVSGSS